MAAPREQSIGQAVRDIMDGNRIPTGENAHLCDLIESDNWLEVARRVRAITDLRVLFNYGIDDATGHITSMHSLLQFLYINAPLQPDPDSNEKADYTDAVKALLEVGGEELVVWYDPILEDPSCSVLYAALGWEQPEGVVEVLLEACPGMAMWPHGRIDGLLNTISHHMCSYQRMDLARWSCLDAIVRAIKPGNIPQNEPLLHLLVYAGPRIPVSLRRHAIKQCKNQLDSADHAGNTPLHIAALLTPVESDEVDFVWITELSKACPIAASMRNHDGKVPFQLAIDQGHPWETVGSLFWRQIEMRDETIASQTLEIERLERDLEQARATIAQMQRQRVEGIAHVLDSEESS